MKKKKGNWLQRMLPSQQKKTGKQPKALQALIPQARIQVEIQPPSPEIMEKVLLSGNLSELTTPQRLAYYESVCRSLGLNPVTKPFEYITLQGKMVLYAKKDCTDQLRRLYGVSIKILSRDISDGMIIVTAQAKMRNGRQDESVGSVVLPPNPEAKAIAWMKAETKAKRRVTLSICGLGMSDESELEFDPEAADQDRQEKREKEAAQTTTEEPPLQVIDDKPITAENYGNLVCHIGNAQSSIIGKKVGEMPERMLMWLDTHYGKGEGKRWGNPPSDKDIKLKQAVEIALIELEKKKAK